ncbi:MAG: hypothetical protein ABJF10_10130, partial [Chthoniobacter sp.]|uniref:hypothetical protein n=1 Tax=Chthoniobacter sp. TaxID=2510640 RepID=UPI0032AD24AB
VDLTHPDLNLVPGYNAPDICKACNRRCGFRVTTGMKHPLTLPTKSLAFIFAAFALAHGAMAQETIDPDEAQKIAQKLASLSTASSEQPFNVDPDAGKPVGIKGGDAGLIIIPDKQFSADVLANAGKTATPVAQLWMHKISLANSGAAVDKAKLRTFTVGDGDKARDVQLFLIGVVKNGQGAAELVIYGKGAEAILHAPVTKHFAAKKDVAIDVSAHKTGEDAAALALDFFGEYATELAVVKAND